MAKTTADSDDEDELSQGEDGEMYFENIGKPLMMSEWAAEYNSCANSAVEARDFERARPRIVLAPARAGGSSVRRRGKGVGDESVPGIPPGIPRERRGIRLDWTCADERRIARKSRIFEY